MDDVLILYFFIFLFVWLLIGKVFGKDEKDEIVLNCEECDSPIKRKNLKYKHCQNCGAELTK